MSAQVPVMLRYDGACWSPHIYGLLQQCKQNDEAAVRYPRRQRLYTTCGAIAVAADRVRNMGCCPLEKPLIHILRLMASFLQFRTILLIPLSDGFLSTPLRLSQPIPMLQLFVYEVSQPCFGHPN
ncbi:hypothetical protein WOLCODRAFT_137704 [Wolfiporia cocos MD-104 SS10]|uniref:Uncharacterized protein n=1 Tax=Wolfiporia cocos (strain MD-104) TaxID=742152 RepID=A0A2H3JJT1_WOLCO|nr:hypothetical protein WOLCODRAFT_137704 [Wolfiporia cocos MD-104 SS10]